MGGIPPVPISVNRIICGDCITEMQKFPANFFDTVITDPPYGLGFMGKEWDTFTPGYKADNWAGYESQPKTGKSMHAGKYDHSYNAHNKFQQWFTMWAKECLRVAKPGAFLLCFGGTRTFHRLTCAIEDAGWEIRDCMMWLYGSGFPKSYNIGQSLQKKLTIGKCRRPDRDLGGLSRNRWSGSEENKLFANTGGQVEYTEELARQWNGWGTALKPAWEPIIVAMKPLDGTFAQNAEKHGVAGLWIDGGRIGMETRITSWMSKNSKDAFNRDDNWQPKNGQTTCQGRWPANLILDEESAKMLDEQSGKISYGKKRGGYSYQGKKYQVKGFVENCQPQAPSNYADSGGASRFFKVITGDYKCINANIVIENLNPQSQVEDSVLNLVAIEDNQEDKLLSDLIHPFMNAIREKLKQDSKENTKQIQTSGQKCLQELKHMSMERLNKNFVNNVEIQMLINTMMIIQNLLSIDGFAEVVMSNSILRNTVLGEQDLRFKYCAKASKAERNKGLEGLPKKQMYKCDNSGQSLEIFGTTDGGRQPRANFHPTVKPLALMEYLCKLTKIPDGGIVLDPFGGSGTTAIACIKTGRKYILIEKESEYCEIARKRVGGLNGGVDAVASSK